MSQSRDATALGRGFPLLCRVRRPLRITLSGPKVKSATATGCDMALHVLMVLLVLAVIYLFYAVIHPCFNDRANRVADWVGLADRLFAQHPGRPLSRRQSNIWVPMAAVFSMPTRDIPSRIRRR